MIVRGCEGREVKRSSSEKIPIKRFQMAHIKDNPVPLGDRAVVVRLRANDGKERIGLRPCFGKPVDQKLRVDDGAGSHTHLLRIRCGPKETGAPQTPALPKTLSTAANDPNDIQEPWHMGGVIRLRQLSKPNALGNPSSVCRFIMA